MKEKDFFEQYSQAVEMAECRIADFKKFSERYNFDDREYFIDKLTNMGFSKDEVLSIVVNKDLLLTLFFNSFEIIVIDNDLDTIVDIDVEVEKARKAYIDAVDTANQSIEAANEAQKIMLSLKSLLESKYGFNSNDWDEDSVHEMNEAIKLYNRLVEKANLDVEYSSKARKELAKARSKKQNIVQTNDVVLETS